MSEELASNLQQLGIFDSIYESRVLAYLILHPQNKSGKDLSEALQISDSKIYPTLKQLVELEYLIKDDSERPHRYYLNPPEHLLEKLNTTLTEQHAHKQQILESCTSHIYDGWHASYPVSDKLGQFFYGESIITQIQSLSTISANNVRYFLSPSITKYIETLVQLLEDQLHQEIDIHLSIPHNQTYIDGFTSILKSNDLRNIHLTQSNLKNESYIIFDQHLIFSILKQTHGTLAYYSEDRELYFKLNSLWKNTDYNTSFHRLLRFE